jgi:hypothetical protein
MRSDHFEIMGNRGTYFQGWTAATNHCPRGWPTRHRSITTSGSCTGRRLKQKPQDKRNVPVREVVAGQLTSGLELSGRLRLNSRLLLAFSKVSSSSAGAVCLYVEVQIERAANAGGGVGRCVTVGFADRDLGGPCEWGSPRPLPRYHGRHRRPQ